MRVLVCLLLALVALCALAVQAEEPQQFEWAALVETLESALEDAALADSPLQLDAQPEQPAAADSDSLVEVDAGRHRYSRHAEHGWAIAAQPPRRVQQRLPKPRLTGAAATLTRANVRCVLCQFISQKIKNSMSTPAADAPVSLIEAFSALSAAEQSRVENTVRSQAEADAKSQALPALFDSSDDPSRRFRHTDALVSRASSARFTAVRKGNPSPETEAQRAAYLKLYSQVYATFESLCAKRMPLAYLPYCDDMLKSYRHFARGVNFGDRADQICMNANFCDHRAYVRKVAHNLYQREPGDA